MKNICNKILNLLKTISIIVLALIGVLFILAIFYLSVDFIFKNILPFTSRAVLANFIVFSAIIVIVVKKFIKPNEALEVAQNEIKNKIENSQNTKEESQKRLASTKESLENIGALIESIFKQSNSNAQKIGEKIVQDAHKTASSIQNDTDKTIKNNQNSLKTDLIKRTSKALIEIAKAQIVNELEKNPQLHNKLIEESIETITLNKQVNEV